MGDGSLGTEGREYTALLGSEIFEILFSLHVWRVWRFLQSKSVNRRMVKAAAERMWLHSSLGGWKVS